MGKRLIIKGANFLENALALSEAIVMLVEQGGYNLITTSTGHYGEVGDANGSTVYNKRLRTDHNSLIYLEAGSNITFFGLSGKQNAHSPLRIDACIYSSSTPGIGTIIGTLNGQTTNYLPFNLGGGNTCVINITRTGWYGFVFGAQDTNSSVTASDYNGTVRYKVQT